MMKRILFLTLLICSFAGVMAQPGAKRMTKEQIFAQKWEFIVAKAQLSTGDAAKVQPLFFEAEEQVWQLFTGNRQIFRSQRRNNPGEIVNFEAINDAIIETELSKANLQKAYYMKLKKVVDAETINKIFHAEKAYQKDIIQKIPSGGRPGRP
jgi:hypothetical protein